MKRLAMVCVFSGLLGFGCTDFLSNSRRAVVEPAGVTNYVEEPSGLTAVLAAGQQSVVPVVPGPWTQPVNTLIGAAIGISSALGGWLARHKANPKG